MSTGTPEKGKRNYLDWKIVAIVAVVVVAMRLFVFSSFWVPSASMEPTFKTNTLIVATKEKAQRGEVIVFKAPHWGSDTNYTKRVMGVGGDTIGGCDNGGRLLVNGKPIVETYLNGETGCNFDPVTVPEGRLWVMGDNRGDSADSRYHTLVTGDVREGTVAEEDVAGVVHVTLWPPALVKS